VCMCVYVCVGERTFWCACVMRNHAKDINIFKDSKYIFERHSVCLCVSNKTRACMRVHKGGWR